MATSEPAARFDPRALSRPVPALLRYYLIMALFALPAFPIVALLSFFKYETLRYRFDDEGVTMAWGILYRREITLGYRRIQDIHVTRNIIERWMGLATVAVQTASATSGPQMQIQGVYEYAELRDFLYMKMRGARGEHSVPDGTSEGPAGDDSLALLAAIRDEIVHLREELAGGRRS